MNGTEQPSEEEERLEDRRRRRADAVDVLVETLIDMLRKHKREAREGMRAGVAPKPRPPPDTATIRSRWLLP